MSSQKQKILVSVCFAAYILVCALIFIYIGKPFISMMDRPGEFREWVSDHGIFGPIIFFVIFLLQIFFAIIPGEPFEIAAGYTFGAELGTVICLAAIVAGQAIIFCLVRRFGMRILEIFIPREKIESFKFLSNSAYSLKLIFLLYLIPGIPKDLVAYCSGLTKVSFSSYIIVSLISRLPSVVTSTFGGSALSDGNYIAAAIIFTLTAIISLIGFIIFSKVQNNMSSKKSTHAKD